MFNWVLWGFNYSKMAKVRFLIDSDTFWMILGTFEIFDFLDPWWTLEPRISHEFTWTNTRKIWEHPGENIIFGNLRIEIFENFELPESLCVHFLNF